MKKEPTNKKIDAENYPRIRKIIESKAFKHKEVAAMFGISMATVYVIGANETYDDYVNYMREQTRKSLERRQAKRAKEEKNSEAKTKPAQTIAPNFYEAQLDIIIEQLKAINDKLAKLPVMQELYKEEDEPETKRGFFGIKKPF